DLGVAADAVPAAGAELPVDQVREGAGDGEQVVPAGGPVEGDGGLDQVSEGVELVRPFEVGEGLLGGVDLDPGHHVAGGLLGAGDEGDGLVEPGVPDGRAGAGDLPGDGLDGLVDVGVGDET